MLVRPCRILCKSQHFLQGELPELNLYRFDTSSFRQWILWPCVQIFQNAQVHVKERYTQSQIAEFSVYVDRTLAALISQPAPPDRHINPEQAKWILVRCFDRFWDVNMHPDAGLSLIPEDLVGPDLRVHVKPAYLILEDRMDNPVVGSASLRTTHYRKVDMEMEMSDGSRLRQLVVEYNQTVETLQTEP